MIHGQDVDHAGRQTGLLHGLGDFERRGRRVVARAHHHGIAGNQRRGDFAQQGVNRVVERDQAGDHANRFAVQKQVFVRAIAGNDLAFDAARPLGVITGDLRGIAGFVAGVADALAGLGSQGFTDVHRVGFEGIGEGAQEVGAFDAGEFAPGFLRSGCGFDGSCRLVGGRCRNVADQRFGRRIIDRDQRIAGRFDEVAVNKVSLESHVNRPSLFLSSPGSFGVFAVLNKRFIERSNIR
ncbi:hypothetical protein D3C87_1402810 [compost metagenome]